METVTLLYEDYQKELAEDFKNTFLKRASDTDSSRSNDAVIDEVTDMLSTNIAVYTEKLLRQWGFSSGGEGGSGGGDVTVTLDDLLQKYLEDNYVTIKGDQEVYGEKDFRKGIRIAGRRLYWDESNDALVIEGAAYTTRWLSAYGMSPGGGGAGSGGAAAMYQLIDVSPNDTKDAVLGAEKDYVLTFDGNFWRGMPNKGGLSSKLFTALDKDGNEVNPDDENSEIYAIRANYSLWSVGFLSAKGISDGGAGGGGGGAVALYQLLDVEKNSDITGVAGATKGSVLTFNGDKWYADKPKTAEGINRLFSALDADGNEVDLNDESKLGTITNIRANYALWSVDWISAKGKSSGGSGGGGGLISLVYGFESLGGTFDNNDNTATFNAFTINEIWKLASSGLTNVTVTGSGNAVTDVTKGSDGRSLTFTKGNMFASKSEFDALNTKFNDFLTGSDADDIINKWSELEVFLQGMKESDNLAVILQSKMDKSAFNKLFSALDSDGNEIDPSDDTKTVAAIRANFGFWGVDYVSAKGVSMSGVQTGTLADLTDVEITNPTNGQALKYDAISQKWVNGTIDSFNVNQMWTELTKADSSKVIDASHIPTSVLDNRWVKKAGDTMTGTLTSASTTGSIIFKGLENCDITNIYTNNGTLYSDTNLAIRNGLRFNWYDTYWYIGNLRGAATNSSGFGIANESNKLCLQVTPDYTTAPVFRSSASQGTAPLIVYSTTQVSNLNADLLDGYHQTSFLQTNGSNQYVSLTGGDGNNEGYRLVLDATVSGGWSISSMTLLVTSRHSGTGVISIVFHTTNQDSTAFVGSLNYYGSLISFGSTMWRLFYNTSTKKLRLFWHFYDHNDCRVSILNRRGVMQDIANAGWYTTIPDGMGTEIPSYYNRSDTTGSLATSRTLWGQPFNGTANVSGDMTGVGSITMSGDLKIGNATSPNTIYFYGTTGDGPGSYSHTFIAERIWGGTECSELVLFKGNDIGNGTDAITVSNSGPDRIRHIAAAHLFQTYTTGLSGSVESVCTSSALKNLFSIASNRVISYVQLQSTIASGVAPFIVASNTVVSNLNADLLDGQHLSDLDGRYVNVTGDTMTGDLTMNNTKGFNMGSGTRVVKTSGNWIHGGGDTASSTDANLRFASWYGIGWYPTIDTASGVRQGNNAMWLNVRTGVLNVAGGIKESNICIGRVDSNGNYNINCAGEISRYDHHLYLQRNSGKNLIMCTGGGLAGIGTDSPGEKLHVAGNTRTDGYFRSTVGTGTQPYQCSSTTLNTNLNADLLDGYHISQISLGYPSGHIKHRVGPFGGGQDKNWRKIVTYVNTTGGQYKACTIIGTIWINHGNHSQGQVTEIPFQVVLYAYGETANSQVNGNYLYIPPYCTFDCIRIVRYASNSWELQIRQYSDWTTINCEYSAFSTGGGTINAGQFSTDIHTSTVTNAYNSNVTTPQSHSVWGVTRTFYIQDYHSVNTGAGVSVNGGSNCYLKLPSTTRFSRIDFSTPDANIRHSGNDNGNEVGSSTLSNLVIDSWYGVSFTTTCSSTYQNKIAMSVNCRTGRVTANNFHAATNITANGAITAKASSSDIRLKTDIQGYDAMGIIRKFRSVKYHWNAIAKENSEVFNHDNWNYGLIAQDLLSGGYSQWVKDTFNDYYTIDYERLIPVVWKGLQEVDDEVTRLRKEVVRLNKRISELEKFLCA